YQHLSLLRQIKPRNQIDDRALPTARATHQRDRLPRLNTEIDLMQHWSLRIIPKRDPPELDSPPNLRQIIRINRVRPFRLPIQQAKHPLCPRDRRQCLVVLITQNLNRTKEDIRQKEKTNQITRRHLNLGRQHAITTNKQNRRNKRLAI